MEMEKDWFGLVLFDSTFWTPYLLRNSSTRRELFPPSPSGIRVGLICITTILFKPLTDLSLSTHSNHQINIKTSSSL